MMTRDIKKLEKLKTGSFVDVVEKGEEYYDRGGKKSYCHLIGGLCNVKRGHQGSLTLTEVSRENARKDHNPISFFTFEPEKNVSVRPNGSIEVTGGGLYSII